MFLRRLAGLAAIVGTAAVAALACFALLLACASAACPQTKAKLVECPYPKTNDCKGEYEEACTPDKKIISHAHGYFEDESNKPEMTETMTDPDPKNKVPCYTYYACQWLFGKCSPSSPEKVVMANPLKTVPCK